MVGQKKKKGGRELKQFESEILKNRAAAESWRELVLSWDASAGEPLPGQFLTLKQRTKAGNVGEPVEVW